jgi:cyclophilin family peptidyl-prolyl cis-trans isomerase
LSWQESQTEGRQARRSGRQFKIEVLEDRRLLASLQPISNLTVPATQGYVQPLLAATSYTDPQTFTVTSSNPNIVASIINGPFWTVTVNYAGSNPFSGPMTFQLFENTVVNGQTIPLTTNTVARITQFTNDNWYTTPTVGNASPTKLFNRIANLTGSAGGFIAQGGGPNASNTGGASGQPNTPFPNENFQQIPLDGSDQIAMANAGVTATGTNDTQFFITTGNLNSALGYNYTVFGQLLTGQTILGKMVAVPTSSSVPTSPIAITAVKLSSTDPNGTLLIDTTQAPPGETAVITITATDTITHTKTSEDFAVTVGPYTGPTSSTLVQTVNFKPFATPGTTTTAVNNTITGAVSSLNVFPVPGTTVPTTYTQLTQPAHGTITAFDPATGRFNYTPDVGFSGTDSFQFDATATGPNNGTNSSGFVAPPATSNPATQTINVGGGVVRQVGTVLIVTPQPLINHGMNQIEVAQVPSSTAPTGAVIQVKINGVVSLTQPDAGSLSEIDVFGGRLAKNNIYIDPSVTVPTVIDSGHARRSFLTGGGGVTIEQSWFGHSTIVGGPGSNYLIGRAGKARFRPSTATRLVFAGVPKRRTYKLHPVPPSGTFYKFVNHKLIPLSEYLKNAAKLAETRQKRHPSG